MTSAQAALDAAVERPHGWRQPTLNGIDGPTLRSVRLSKQVPLRQVAREAGMSHGHLSKVERGEVGRPVTPAVLAAYSRATGVALNTAKPGEGRGGWQLGQLAHRQRTHFNALIGGLSVGGPLGQTMGEALDARGRLPLPDLIDDYQVAQLDLLAELLERLEDATPGLVARTVLRWLVDVLDLFDRASVPEWSRSVTMNEATRAGLFAVVSRLACRAGQAAVQIGSHEAARTQFAVALYAAVSADNADLRAKALAEIASQYSGFDQYDDCLAIVRLAQADERLSEPVRVQLQELKTRSIDARERLASAVRQAVGTDDSEPEAADGGEEAQ